MITPPLCDDDDGPVDLAGGLLDRPTRAAQSRFSRPIGGTVRTRSSRAASSVCQWSST